MLAVLAVGAVLAAYALVLQILVCKMGCPSCKRRRYAAVTYYVTDRGAAKILHIAHCQHLKLSSHEMKFCKVCMPQGPKLYCKICSKED